MAHQHSFNSTRASNVSGARGLSDGVNEKNSDEGYGQANESFRNPYSSRMFQSPVPQQQSPVLTSSYLQGGPTDQHHYETRDHEDFSHGTPDTAYSSWTPPPYSATPGQYYQYDVHHSHQPPVGYPPAISEPYSGVKYTTVPSQRYIRLSEHLPSLPAEHSYGQVPAQNGPGSMGGHSAHLKGGFLALQNQVSLIMQQKGGPQDGSTAMEMTQLLVQTANGINTLKMCMGEQILASLLNLLVRYKGDSPRLPGGVGVLNPQELPVSRRNNEVGGGMGISNSSPPGRSPSPSQNQQPMSSHLTPSPPPPHAAPGVSPMHPIIPPASGRMDSFLSEGGCGGGWSDPWNSGEGSTCLMSSTAAKERLEGLLFGREGASKPAVINTGDRSELKEKVLSEILEDGKDRKNGSRGAPLDSAIAAAALLGSRAEQESTPLERDSSPGLMGRREWYGGDWEDIGTTLHSSYTRRKGDRNGNMDFECTRVSGGSGEVGKGAEAEQPGDHGDSKAQDLLPTGLLDG